MQAISSISLYTIIDECIPIALFFSYDQRYTFLRINLYDIEKKASTRQKRKKRARVIIVPRSPKVIIRCISRQHASDKEVKRFSRVVNALKIALIRVFARKH